MNRKSSVIWNQALRLAVSDVDETIADIYKSAEPAMIQELSLLLSEGKKLFMVTGGSLKRVTGGITDHLKPKLRANILVSHCSGAEVWGFTSAGTLKSKPFYSVYEGTFTAKQKDLWRLKVQELLREFKLNPHPVMPVLQFVKDIGTDPLDIMFDDRGPQITLEFVNAYDLSEAQVAVLEHDVPRTHDSYDLRIPVLERAEQLFTEAGLPVAPRLGGTFALDFAVKGVSKTTSIHHILKNKKVFETIGLTPEDISNPKHIEIWGDKFSVLRGGTDRHMCEALPPEVRAIDFREEDPEEFMQDSNIVIWNGEKHLHHGLLEYLQSRHSA